MTPYRYSAFILAALLAAAPLSVHAAPAPASSLPELQRIHSKIAGAKFKSSDSRWSQKRILQLLPHILNGEDVNISLDGMKGNTCLHYACELGSRSLIQWLVENGADVNRVEWGGGNTPLHCSARLASLYSVNYLLEHGANPDIANNEGLRPVDMVGNDDHDAICAALRTTGKSRVIADAAKEGDRIDEKPAMAKENWKPDKASKHASLSVKKGELNTQDVGSTSSVVVNKQREARIITRASIEELRKIFTQIKEAQYESQKSCESREGLIRLLPLILNGSSVDVSLEDMEGNTALHYACELDCVQLIHWLVEHGANVNRQGRYGNTPLHYSSRLASLHSVTYLLNHGAKVEISNNFGQYPRDVMAYSYSIENLLSKAWPKKMTAYEWSLDDNPVNVNENAASDHRYINQSIISLDNFTFSAIPRIVYANEHVICAESFIRSGFKKITTQLDFYNASTLIKKISSEYSNVDICDIKSNEDDTLVAVLLEPNSQVYDEHYYVILYDSVNDVSEKIVLTPKYMCNANHRHDVGISFDGSTITVKHLDPTLNGIIRQGRLFKNENFRKIYVQRKLVKQLVRSIDTKPCFLSGQQKLLFYWRPLGFGGLFGSASYYNSNVLRNGKNRDYLSEVLCAPTKHGFIRLSSWNNFDELDTSNLTETKWSIPGQSVITAYPLSNGAIHVIHRDAASDSYAKTDLIGRYSDVKAPHASASIFLHGEQILSETLENVEIDYQTETMYKMEGGQGKAPVSLTIRKIGETADSARKTTFPYETKDFPLHKIALRGDVIYMDPGDGGKCYNSDKCVAFSISYGRWLPSETNRIEPGQPPSNPYYFPDMPSGWSSHIVSIKPSYYWVLYSPEGSEYDINRFYNTDDVNACWMSGGDCMFILSAGEGQANLVKFNLKADAGNIVHRWYSPNKHHYYWDNERHWLYCPVDNGMIVQHITQAGEVELVYQIVYFENGGKYAILLPDGRYTGSPGCEKYLRYRYKNISVPMSIMAPWLKDPAGVIELLGGNMVQAEALDAAKRRWLNKIGISSSTPLPDFNKMPIISVDAFPALNTDDNEISIPVTVTARGEDVVGLDVRVNEVPQAGLVSRQSFPLKSGETATLNVRAQLSHGHNWVTIQAMTDTRLGSDIERFRVICKREVPSTLYVVALGVSNYENEKVPDLKLAAKDASDIIHAFSACANGNVKTLLLQDSEISSETALARIKEFLSTATLHDRIVVYCSGHGVLCGTEYYFAPANFDPDTPERTGISMDSLLGALSSNQARGRLLMLDTCNAGTAGEEAEEKMAMAMGDLPTGVRAIQHRGMQIKSADLALPSSQKKRYIEELFATGDEDSGVNLIGGAGAAEYAMESDAWSNGVFTAAVIEALTTDKVTNNTIPEIGLEVSNFADYVYRRVRELTGGKQKPFIRLFEAAQNFRLK